MVEHDLPWHRLATDGQAVVERHVSAWVRARDSTIRLMLRVRVVCCSRRARYRPLLPIMLEPLSIAQPDVLPFPMFNPHAVGRCGGKIPADRVAAVGSETT